MGLNKVLKGFFVFILFELVLAIYMSFLFQKVFVHEVVTETVKEQVLSQIESEDPAYKEKIEELFNDKDVSKMVDQYLDITIEGLTEEDDKELKEKAMDFIKNNKGVIEEEFNVEIPDESIEKLEEADVIEKITEMTENVSKQAKKLTEKERMILKIYYFIVSYLFKIIVGILILLDLIALCLIDKSVFVWIKHLSITSIFSGISLIIISFVLKYIVQISTYNLISINVSKISIYGVIITLVSLLIYTIYAIVSHVLGKDEEIENEVKD